MNDINSFFKENLTLLEAWVSPFQLYTKVVHHPLVLRVKRAIHSGIHSLQHTFQTLHKNTHSFSLWKKNSERIGELHHFLTPRSPEEILRLSDLTKTTRFEIIKAIEHCVKRAESKETPCEAEVFFINNFFNLLNQVGPPKFFPDLDLGGAFSLQRLLSPELDHLLKKQEENVSLLRDPDHQLDLALAKARLAVRFGHGVKTVGKGVHGALILHSLENEEVGVFKPSRPMCWWYLPDVLRHYFGQNSLLSEELGAHERSEERAYKVDKCFQLHVAPPAKMSRLMGEEGAFLLYLDGYEELKSVEKRLNARDTRRDPFSEKEKELVQRGMLHEYITGNLDGHNENIFIKLDDQGHIIDLKIIDHGNSFPQMNPRWLKFKQYKALSRLHISKEPWTEKMKNIVGQWQDSQLKEFMDSESKKVGWSKNSAKLTLDRFEVIKQGITSGRLASPYALSKIQTSAQFEEFLKV